MVNGSDPPFTDILFLLIGKQKYIIRAQQNMQQVHRSYTPFIDEITI